MRSECYVTPENREERILRWTTAMAANTAPRDHWRLQPPNAALLVIDVQRVFCAPDGAHFLPAFVASRAPLETLVAAWRKAGRPVIFTRHGHAPDQQTGVHGRFHGSVLRRDAPDAELVPPARPEPDDWILEKDTYDAFFGTGLAERLRVLGCSQVLVAGVLTHLCVESTVRSAFVHGFEPFVAMDACASSTARLHEDALVAMASGFAGVITAQAAVESCP